MNKPVERLYNGVIKENPTLVLMLGMCPTLAVTTSAINGLGMGLIRKALALNNATIEINPGTIVEKINKIEYAHNEFIFRFYQNN